MRRSAQTHVYAETPVLEVERQLGSMPAAAWAGVLSHLELHQSLAERDDSTILRGDFLEWEPVEPSPISTQRLTAIGSLRPASKAEGERGEAGQRG